MAGCAFVASLAWTACAIDVASARGHPVHAVVGAAVLRAPRGARVAVRRRRTITDRCGSPRGARAAGRVYPAGVLQPLRPRREYRAERNPLRCNDLRRESAHPQRSQRFADTGELGVLH